MKKLVPILVVAILVVVLVLSGCAAPVQAPAPKTTPTPAPAPPPAAKPVKIVYEGWLPPTHTGMKTTEKFFKGLETATNGLVTTEFNMAGVMGKPAESYGRLVSGVTGVSQFGPAYTPGAFPMFSMFYNPIKAPSIDAFVKAMAAMHKKGNFDKDFAEVKIIGLYGAGPFILFTTDKKITSVKDIEGMKLRAANDAFVDVIKTLKAAPVTMPSGEVYLALQKGVVDGAWWVWDAISTDKVGEVTKYLWDASMSIFPHIVAMNKNVWNSLPQSGKDYIDKNWEQYCIDWAAETDVKKPAIKQQFVGYPGREITELSASEWSNFSATLAPVWTKWIADVEAKGLPAKKGAADLYKILTDLGVKDALVGFKP